jgi:hypothetical protein
LPTAQPTTVLILTHSADRYVIERVGAALEQRGVGWMRLDTDLYPSQVGLDWSVEREHVTAALYWPSAPMQGLGLARTELPLDQVRAVWARKLWRAQLPSALETRLVEGCQREIRAALLGGLGLLEARPWINDLGASARAEDKLLQLRLGREVGLTVPRTLVSNRPAAVRQFRQTVGPLVAKMLTPLTVGMQQAPLFVHTNRVSDRDLQQLDGLAVCPMVFQEEIQKRLELRVAYVAGRCFAGALDASASRTGQTDWRLSAPGEWRWQRHSLPRELEQRLGALMGRLGLQFGAIDLILTPGGEYVFLEVNPSGEWGMLEHELDLPISTALAEALIELSRPSL